MDYDNVLENEYSMKTDIKYRRSLGQFFTPYKIASFMADWILNSNKNVLTILDPATGLGIFERAIKSKNAKKNIKFDLFEIDSNVSSRLSKIISNLGIDATIINSDFLAESWDKKYDGIIANPPYYKHHFIKNKEDIFQNICVRTYYKFSIQTNIYCWFLIKSISLLLDGGRLAFIVPSEFLNANYGEKIKEYLVGSGIALNLINVNFEENVFDNAITTSAIILAEKNLDKSTAINFFSISNIKQLDDLNEFLSNHPRKTINNYDLNPRVKWRNYFNGYKQKDDKNFVPFSGIGKFSRGIATGSNEYFTLTPEEIKYYQISKECLAPCIAKASFVKDILFSADDFEMLVRQNRKTFLFDGEKSNHKTCVEYIKRGEDEDIHNRFLTKNRTPWFALEKRDVSKIWVSVFGRSGLKFVWNTSNCKNLTCFHSFYPTEIGKKYLDILFIYINTNFAKNLFDREKREYGNGLEKFEPNDINKSLILNFEIISEKDIDLLEKLQKQILNKDSKNRLNIIEDADSIFRSYLQSA